MFRFSERKAPLVNWCFDFTVLCSDVLSHQYKSSIEEKGACCSTRMALIPRFAFFALLLLPYLIQCEAMAEDCSQTQCLLLPVEDDQVASEFRLKASEKGVRLVYINLVIGNASYDPLELPVEFLPHRWIWARTALERMLSLPEDYDILSASLLNYQVRSIEVKLKDQPSGCLAKLNSRCQNLAVGRMLLENVTSSISSDILHENTPVVCVAILKTTTTDASSEHVMNYHCCNVHKEPRTGPATIRCGQRIDVVNWVEIVSQIFYFLSLSLALFTPALPLILPDYVFSLKDEDEKENRPAEQISGERARLQRVINEATEGEQDNHQEETSKFIPVDDSSPMNLSTLLRESVQKLPNIPLSFNIKLAVIFLCVFPCALYAQIGLYHVLKKTSIDEITKKHVQVYSVFSSGIVSLEFGFELAVAFGMITIFISVLLLRPEDFFLREEELCLVCRHISLRNNNSFNFSLASRATLGDEMYRHLKLLLHYFRHFTVCIFTYPADIGVSIYCCLSLGCQLENKRKESRVWHLLCVFFRFIYFVLALPFIILVGVLYLLCSIMVLIILLYVLSPALTIFFFLLTKISNRLEERPVLLKIVQGFGFILTFPSIYLYCFLVKPWIFILTVVAYTIIGLALNARIVTPFLAFFLVLTANLYLCYAKMQRKYKEVKKMISARLQLESHMNRDAPKGTICAQIYWFVCGKVLPVKSEMCRMLCNMISAAAFLFLALSAVVFIAHEHDISTLTTTISVFFTGTIPPLFLKVLTTRNRIVGWAKIKMEREIDQEVTP